MRREEEEEKEKRRIKNQLATGVSVHNASIYVYYIFVYIV